MYNLNGKFIENIAAYISIMMVFVGISGCFSVLFGAWLAHGGKMLLESEQLSLSTALQYQLFHTVALLGSLVWLKVAKPSIILLIACVAFIIGILFFSGSIYLTVLFDSALIGKLTPFGGITLACAWLLLAIGSKNNF